MAETPIVSDTLQKTFRDNFPSQISSGRDLHVSDTIVPIVDFSSTAGVSGLSTSLQESLFFLAVPISLCDEAGRVIICFITPVCLSQIGRASLPS